ncbi:MAG: sulfatase-like hydrolase/transferase [Planctomycetes bacterium]|nr:sulfatase-like hydrolase/transferase [Planctomycetota bacterium]
MRRLAPLLCAAALLASCAKERAAPQGNGLDVLLCVIDTLRADHLGCYGYGRATSPTIDRLAAEGVRVAQATAQSSWTGPSMVSMMLSRHVADDFVKMPRGATLAQILAEAGYRTAAVQSNILLEAGSGLERGFEDYALRPLPPQFTEILRHDDGRPRFIYVHLTHPHDPYEPAPQFDVFKPGPLPRHQIEDYAAFLEEAHPTWSAAERSRALDKAAAHVAAAVARYDGEILQADKVVADVLSLLPRPEQTIVVIAADHGECLWERREAPSALLGADTGDLLTVFKPTHNVLLSEELIHVPLILRGPGVPAGAVLPGLAENVDILPTILELLGLEPPEDIDGISLAAGMARLAAGEEPAGRDIVFCNTTLFTAARARGGEKLILPWREVQPDQPARFDLAVDPGERAPLPLAGREFAGLAGAIEEFRGRALRASSTENVLDADVERRLRELGYVGK